MNPRADLWVDFNDLDSVNELCSLTQFARDPASLYPGQFVVIGDGEGLIAIGEIKSVDSRGCITIYVVPNTYADIEED